MFLSSDGIRPIAGTDRQNDVELSLLSSSIQYTIENFITNYDMNDLVGVVIKNKTQFRYFYLEVRIQQLMHMAFLEVPD